MQGRRSFWAVTYQFQEDGQLYEGEQEVSREHYKTLTDGEEVELRYLEGDPYVVVLAGDDRDDARMRRYRNSSYLQLTLVGVCLFLLVVSLSFVH
jgi:hypothetical protein